MYQGIKRVVCLNIIFAVLVVMSSCSSMKKSEAMLCKHWIHNHEKDEGKIKSYVPKDTELPPSRPRRQYIFQKDGVLKEITGGRSDRGAETIGTWKWDKNVKKEKRVNIILRKNKKTYNDVYKIMELTSESLKLEKL